MNIMRYSFILFAFAAATLTSFGQSSTNSSPKTIVGTWQWVSVDQQAIPYPFFMRFYSNGIAATWPAPDGFSTTNGVSRGGYHFDGAVLTVDVGAGTNNPKSQIEIKGGEMIMMTCDETNRYIYRRVVPDLEPGKFLPGHPSHGPPDL